MSFKRPLDLERQEGMLRVDAILGNRRKSRRKKYKFFNRGCVTVYNNKSLTCTGQLPEKDKRRARKRRRTRRQQLAQLRIQAGRSSLPKRIAAPSGTAMPLVENCNLEVQNWVITCDIETPLHPSAARLTRFSLDLHMVAIQLRYMGMQYNPERFHAVIRRFRNPSAAVLAFEGGAIVCTGAKTQERAELLVSTTLRDIATIPMYRGIRMKKGSWNVRNVVGSASMPFEIDLQRLYNANSQCSAYEPEIFPGATFRLVNPYARAILVFESGSLVITGATIDTNLSKALDLCIPYIWAARKGISAEQSALDAPTKSVEQVIREQTEKDARCFMPYLLGSTPQNVMRPTHVSEIGIGENRYQQDAEDVVFYDVPSTGYEVD